MQNQFIGAYNLSKSNDFMSKVERKMDQKTLGLNVFFDWIKNNSLIIKGINNKTNTKIISLENIKIILFGKISGYMVTLPNSRHNDDLINIYYLYKNYGNEFAKYINGHFSLILLDTLKENILLIQDKFPGIVTLYWVIAGDVFYFSNFIKPLLALSPDTTSKINNKALYQFLKYTYISSPNTIFEDIYQICGGEMISIENARIVTTVYDKWEFPVKRISDENEALVQYQGVLSDSIQKFLSQNSNTAFLLSGGLDSSVNVALGAKLSSAPIITVGIGAEKYFTDAPYARKVSGLFHTNHHEYLFDGSEIENLPLLVWLMENPYYEAGLLLSYASLKEAGAFFPNIIGGDAADQVFGSCVARANERYRAKRQAPLFFKMFHKSVHHLSGLGIFEGNYFVNKIKQRLVGSYDVNNWCGVYGFRNSDIKELLQDNFHFEELYDNFDVPDGNLNSLLDYGCTVLNQGYTINGLLSKTGRISNYLGLNSYSPFLDKNVFNFILSLDHNLRNRLISPATSQYISKYLHRKLAEKLLTPEIVDRPKQGGAINPYIHLADANRLNGIKKAILHSEFLNSLFIQKKMEVLFKDPFKNSTRIIMLLVLDLWYHIFISNSMEFPNFTLDQYLNKNRS